MSIAVLTSNERVCPQCGEIVQLTVVDFDPATHTVRHTSLLTPPPMSVAALAGWLREQGVGIVLASGINPQARAFLEAEGIQVVVGVPTFRVEPVVSRFLTATLETGPNICEQ
jgi:predicted Fe-Mo cluster-binding NifX family protein